MTIDGHPALAGVVKARQQVDDGGLAGAGGTQQRHSLPGFGGEADLIEHRLAAAKIAKSDILEAHPARDDWQGLCPGFVAHLVFGVEDFEYAPRGGSCLPELGDDKAKLGKWQENVHQVQTEFLPYTQAQGSVQDLLTAEIQGGSLPQVGDQEYQWEQEGEQARQLDLLVHQRSGRLLEFCLLALFAVECFNQLNPRQVFLQQRIEGR